MLRIPITSFRYLQRLTSKKHNFLLQSVISLLLLASAIALITANMICFSVLVLTLIALVDKSSSPSIWMLISSFVYLSLFAWVLLSVVFYRNVDM